MAFVITFKDVTVVLAKTLIALPVTIAIFVKSANNVFVRDVTVVICAIYVIAFVLSSKSLNDLVCFNGAVYL
jgi:hypothetical protein